MSDAIEEMEAIKATAKESMTGQPEGELSPSTSPRHISTTKKPVPSSGSSPTPKATGSPKQDEKAIDAAVQAAVAKVTAAVLKSATHGAPLAVSLVVQMTKGSIPKGMTVDAFVQRVMEGVTAHKDIRLDYTKKGHPVFTAHGVPTAIPPSPSLPVPAPPLVAKAPRTTDALLAKTIATFTADALKFLETDAYYDVVHIFRQTSESLPPGVSQQAFVKSVIQGMQSDGRLLLVVDDQPLRFVLRQPKQSPPSSPLSTPTVETNSTVAVATPPPTLLDTVAAARTDTALKCLRTTSAYHISDVANFVQQMKPGDRGGVPAPLFLEQLLERMVQNPRLQRSVDGQGRHVFVLKMPSNVQKPLKGSTAAAAKPPPPITPKQFPAAVKAVADKRIAHAVEYLKKHPMYPVGEIDNVVRQIKPQDRKGDSAAVFLTKVIKCMAQDKRLLFVANGPKGKPGFTQAKPPATTVTKAASSVNKPTPPTPSVSALPPKANVSMPSPLHASAPPTGLSTWLTDPAKDKLTLVATVDALHWVLRTDPAFQGEPNSVVALDCEGVPTALLLLQMATDTATYVVDSMAIGPAVVVSLLRRHLEAPTLTKLFYDLHQDVAALVAQCPDLALVGTWDMQLAMEHRTGELHMSFQDMLKRHAGRLHPSKDEFKHRMTEHYVASNESLFSVRPLDHDVLEYAAYDALLLLDRYDAIEDIIDDNEWAHIQVASDARARSAVALNGQRKLAFDKANRFAFASFELLAAARPHDMYVGPPLVVHGDLDPILSLLPPEWSEVLSAPEVASTLSDIVLDKGRRPWAWSRGVRLLLGDEDREVT
ncbi:hypothetical protein As57867_013949, partial [Aphanomyces stellatus]